jgi:hypothetical protein
MLKQAILSAMLLGAIPVCHGEAVDHTKMWGTWKTDGPAGSEETWILREDGGTLHLTQVRGAQKSTDLTCNLLGRDCKVKINGREATVSFYFNGPLLVQWEKEGTKVERRRFKTVDDGGTLEIETTSIVPNGKAETIRLKRADDTNTIATTTR